jgi:hypothetical protein
MPSQAVYRSLRVKATAAPLPWRRPGCSLRLCNRRIRSMHIPAWHNLPRPLHDLEMPGKHRDWVI